MTVNRGLDGPLFLCPDAYAMKHTILNKILNALTFGMLNRISDLEHNHTMSVIETAGAFNKLDRVDTDVSALEKRLIQQGDSLTDLREHVRAVLNSESQALKEMIRSEVEANADDILKEMIKSKGLIRESDLPDFDDYWTDNDCFSDRVLEIVRDDNDFTDRDDVRGIISDELDEKNYATKSDVEQEVSTAIETHEECHHAEEEEEESQDAPDDEGNTGKLLNDLMKPAEPIVLTGKMKTISMALPTYHDGLTSMALTEAESNLVFAHRAYLTDGEDHCDTWMEVIYNHIDGEDARMDFLVMLYSMASEYSYRYAVGLEGDAHSLRKEGRQADASHMTIKGHGYEMAGQHLAKTKDIIESLDGLADFVTDRIEDKDSE